MHWDVHESVHVLTDCARWYSYTRRCHSVDKPRVLGPRAGGNEVVGRRQVSRWALVVMAEHQDQNAGAWGWHRVCVRVCAPMFIFIIAENVERALPDLESQKGPCGVFHLTEHQDCDQRCPLKVGDS